MSEGYRLNSEVYGCRQFSGRDVMNYGPLRSSLIARISCKARTVLFIPFAALTACGVNSTTAPSSSAYPNLNGNWEARTTSSNAGIPGSPIASFTGALQSSGSAVSGTFRALDPNFLSPCVTSTQNLSATGTLDSNGDLVLSIPISGGMAKITATLGPNLQIYTPGTLQISGGLCAMPSSTTSIIQYAPINGTYTGTLSDTANVTNTATVTAVLTQSDGRFPISGSVSSTGLCPGTRPLLPEVVSGGGILTSGSTSYPGVMLTGAILPAADHIQVIVGILDLNCLTAVLDGSLTKQ